MAKHNQNIGRNIALPNENRPTWSPQDRAQSSLPHRGRETEDDHDYRSWRDRTYRDDDRAAGEFAPGRWDGRRGEDRSAYAPYRTERYPSPGSFEDRHHDLGGRAAHERMGLHAGAGHRAEPLTYRSEIYGRGSGYGSQHHGVFEGRSQHHPAIHVHAHHGTGPHRGKGPRGYRRSDERLYELVCESLAEDDQLDASQIEVSVHDGEVMLSGTVEDRQAKREAEDCAYSISGVRDVLNQLRVAGDPSSVDTTSRNPSSTASGPSQTSESEPSSQDKKHHG